MKFTKKDRIIKRLIDGEDPEVIAREEKTTKSYVYKVNSTDRIKIDQESNGTKNIDQNKADLDPENISPNKGLDRTSSLGREDRKKLYRDFHDDLSNEEIIRKHGFDPIIVQHEREAAYNQSRFKPYSFLKELLFKLGKTPEEVGWITSNFKDGLSSNQELVQLITAHINATIEERGGDRMCKMIGDLSIRVPDELTRLKCSRCFRDIPGAILDGSLPKHLGEIIFLCGFLCKQCDEASASDSWNFPINDSKFN